MIPFDNVKWEEENWQLKDAKAFAKKYNMQVAVCRTCKRPHVWAFGQYVIAPLSCGRDACAPASPKVVMA